MYAGVWSLFFFVASLTILTNGGIYAAAGVSHLRVMFLLLYCFCCLCPPSSCQHMLSLFLPHAVILT